jgi:hypothetical protein
MFQRASESPARGPRRNLGHRLAWSLALPLAVASVMTTAGVAAAAPPPNFGPNVVVIDPSMSTAQIQATVDAISTQQIPDSFGNGRYEIAFKPGVYGADQPLNFRIGYYTDFAGLGALPTDVVINGTIDAYNQCDSGGSCVASNNFWRSVSNLTLNVAGKGGCQTGGRFRRPRRCGVSKSTETPHSWTTAVARPTRAAASSPTRCSRAPS